MARSLVVEYVTEEVARQGHDVHSIDGITRVGWMLYAWRYALERDRELEAADMEMLGTMVEPRKNCDGIRTVNVRVGYRICGPPERVQAQLGLLWRQRAKMSPLDFYREFELIHPFVDGNGRTGKILLNWLNGTLLAPVFPPNDFWGQPIQNP